MSEEQASYGVSYIADKPEKIESGQKIDGQNALDTQVGGDHYKTMAIQPVEFICANKLDFISGNICKYAARHKRKNGAQDVEKIIHYAKILLQLEYGYSNEQISQL